MSVQKALHKKVISVYTCQHIRGEYDLLECKWGLWGQGSKGRETLQSHLRNLNSTPSTPLWLTVGLAVRCWSNSAERQ